jgi:hypothetical protein
MHVLLRMHGTDVMVECGTAWRSSKILGGCRPCYRHDKVPPYFVLYTTCLCTRLGTHAASSAYRVNSLGASGWCALKRRRTGRDPRDQAPGPASSGACTVLLVLRKSSLRRLTTAGVRRVQTVTVLVRSTVKI